MEAKKKFIVDVAFYALVLALICLLYKYILPILVPFIVGFCVAALIRLPLRKMHLKNPKHARSMAALLVALFYVVVAGLLVLIGIKIVAQLGSFAAAAPALAETHLLPMFNRLATEVEHMLMPIDPHLTDLLLDIGANAVQSLGQLATTVSTKVVTWVANFAAGIPGILIQVILTIVSTFYCAADYTLIVDFLKKRIPAEKQSILSRGVNYAKVTVLAFVKSYSILFGINFLILCLGLSIMRIPYALLLALLIALFDLMPVLGVGGILLPWSVILLVMGNIPLAIGMLALYLVIAATRNTVEPRIVGNHIGIHPLATLVAMILGLRLVGLVGMLSFPIILVAVVNLRKNPTAEE